MELYVIPIKKLCNYRITRDGRIFDVSKNKYKKFIRSTDYGYLTMTKYYTTFLIHRLVAITFIPNPDNKPHVNHKNGNKHDNGVDNLEWCTASENSLHSFHILKKANNTAFKKGHIYAKSTPCEVIKGPCPGIYRSFNAAGIANNINRTSLYDIAHGKFKRAGVEVRLLLED